MAIPFAAIGAGLGLANSLFGTIKGIGQNRLANRLERSNIRPTATVNSNLVRNAGEAAIAAQTGLSDRVYNNALNQLNTGLNVGTRQIGRMGGTASVASTLQAYNQGINNLAAQDQQAQMQNQNRLFGARTALANDQQRVWNWNEAGRYNEMAQRIAQLRGVGQQNTFNGISTLSTQVGALGDVFSSENTTGNSDVYNANRKTTLQSNVLSNQNRNLFGAGYSNPYRFGSTSRQGLTR